MNINLDQNKDGTIDQRDVNLCKQLQQLRKQEDKFINHSRLAWIAMIAILVVTLLLFMPWIPDSRVLALQNVLDLFYISQASIIGFYVGANTFMNRPNR